MNKKRIFILEDNPNTFPHIHKLREKYEVYHVRNLKDAAYLLEFEPGVAHFDKFIFDAALISERVRHITKGDVTYDEESDGGFNGLLFLVNNLDILGEDADRPDRIAVITALANRLMSVTKILMPNGNKRFVRLDLPIKEKNILHNHNHVPRIRYVAENLTYDFSYLDKSSGDILTQIE